VNISIFAQSTRERPPMLGGPRTSRQRRQITSIVVSAYVLLPGLATSYATRAAELSTAPQSATQQSGIQESEAGPAVASSGTQNAPTPQSLGGTLGSGAPTASGSMPTTGASTSTSGATGANTVIPIAGNAVLLLGNVSVAADSPILTDNVYNQATTATPTEEVTVTTSRQPTNVQTTPAATTIIGAQQLQTAGINRVQQLQYQMPSTSFFFSNTRNAEIAIRGLGNNPANDGLVDSVGVYVDGVYLDRVAMATFGLFDIDQIQVLRGPQGTAFGKNTSAGAVLITTNKPTFTPQASGEVDLGSYNTREYTGFVSGPIQGTWLAARFSLDVSDHSGYVSTIYGSNPYNSLGRDAFRAQLLYQPDDTLSVRTIGEYGIERDTSGFSILYSTGPSNPASTAFNSFAKWTVHAGVSPIIEPNGFLTDANGPQLMRESGGALTNIGEWKSNAGYTLSSIFGFRKWNFEPHNNNIDAIAPLASNGIPLSQQDINNDNQISEELRLASPVGGPIDYVAGFYYFWNQLLGNQQTWFGTDYSTVFSANPALNGSISNFYTNPTTNSYALYGQANWHINPRLTATIGLRESFEQQTININRPLPIGGTPPLPITSIPYFGSGFTSSWTPAGLARLSYKITPDLLGYAFVAQSSKPGGFNAPAIPGQSGTTFLPVSSLVIYPETANDAEIGLKSSWWDHRLTLNSGAFFTRVRNYQANSTISTIIGSVPVVDNVGAVITKGFEVEATAQPLEGLSLSGYGSWNPAYYQSFHNAPSVQGSLLPTQDLTGYPVVGAPRWTGGVSGTYTWPVGSNALAYFYANYGYKSGQYGYIDDSVFSWIKPYGLADFRLGVVVRDRYEFVAWIQNALNAPNFYNVSVMAGNLGGYTTAPGIPRVAGVTLRVKF
jgi:iron complex outermembrane recepter protein